MSRSVSRSGRSTVRSTSMGSRSRMSGSMRLPSSARVSGTVRSSAVAGGGVGASAMSGTSSMTGGSYIAGVTPFAGRVANVPTTTFTATMLAGGLYMVAIGTLLFSSCPWNRMTIQMLMVLMVAFVAISLMLGLNMVYTKYRNNCASLTCSLLYSATVGLLIYALIDLYFDGLCLYEGTIYQVGPVELGAPSNYSSYGTLWRQAEMDASGTVQPETTNSTTMDPLSTTELWPIQYPEEEEEEIILPPKCEPSGVFKTLNVPDLIVWSCTAVGILFQIVGHYFYG